MDRHDESRIKRMIAGGRHSTAIRVITEQAGIGGRPAEGRISESAAVNPDNLIECFFNVIPRRLGKVHGVIDRRYHRMEAFLVRWMCNGGWSADIRQIAYVWIVANDPIVSVVR